VAPESRTHGPREVQRVRPTKDVTECATKVVELGFLRSSYHLRNSLKIAGWLGVSIEVWSTVEGCTGASTTDLGGRPCKA